MEDDERLAKIRKVKRIYISYYCWMLMYHFWNIMMKRTGIHMIDLYVSGLYQWRVVNRIFEERID